MFRFQCHSLIAAAVAAFALTASAHAARGDEVRVAVATNFMEAASDIGKLFERSTGHKALLSFGSTGQLYAQITQGAPFEVYLAADGERPKRTIEAGLAVPGSRFTYATGRLVLFSREAAQVHEDSTLRNGEFTKLVIANPATAPYGAAAMEAMRALGVYEQLASTLVQGNNIAQAYQFVETGNAEIGFVALSQVAGHDKGSRWLVPDHLHAPIAQDAVLLKQGAGNPAAQAFVAFLKGPEARAVKEKYGYGSPGG